MIHEIYIKTLNEWRLIISSSVHTLQSLDSVTHKIAQENVGSVTVSVVPLYWTEIGLVFFDWRVEEANDQN
jgi:hypothetical protein